MLATHSVRPITLPRNVTMNGLRKQKKWIALKMRKVEKKGVMA